MRERLGSTVRLAAPALAVLVLLVVVAGVLGQHHANRISCARYLPLHAQSEKPTRTCQQAPNGVHSDDLSHLKLMKEPARSCRWGARRPPKEG
jgi:hypothetical protein